MGASAARLARASSHSLSPARAGCRVWYQTFLPDEVAVISPVCRSTRRCRETAGRLTENSAASCPAVGRRPYRRSIARGGCPGNGWLVALRRGMVVASSARISSSRSTSSSVLAAVTCRRKPTSSRGTPG